MCECPPLGGPCAIYFPHIGRITNPYGQGKNDSNLENDLDTDKKKNINIYFCVAYSHYFFNCIHRVINRIKYFDISWLIVRMYYHTFNNSDKLINGDLTKKTVQGILYRDLMNRKCNTSNPSEFNDTCVYEGKSRKNV